MNKFNNKYKQLIEAFKGPSKDQILKYYGLSTGEFLQKYKLFFRDISFKSFDIYISEKFMEEIIQILIKSYIGSKNKIWSDTPDLTSLIIERNFDDESVIWLYFDFINLKEKNIIDVSLMYDPHNQKVDRSLFIRGNQVFNIDGSMLDEQILYKFIDKMQNIKLDVELGNKIIHSLNTEDLK